MLLSCVVRFVHHRVPLNQQELTGIIHSFTGNVMNDSFAFEFHTHLRILYFRLPTKNRARDNVIIVMLDQVYNAIVVDRPIIGVGQMY